MRKNHPALLSSLRDSDKTLLDSMGVARRANASGIEAELKAALAKINENNEVVLAVGKAALEQTMKEWKADCEKRGGIFVTSSAGSSCKSK